MSPASLCLVGRYRERSVLKSLTWALHWFGWRRVYSSSFGRGRFAVLDAGTPFISGGGIRARMHASVLIAACPSGQRSNMANPALTSTVHAFGAHFPHTLRVFGAAWLGRYHAY